MSSREIREMAASTNDRAWIVQDGTMFNYDVGAEMERYALDRFVHTLRRRYEPFFTYSLDEINIRRRVHEDQRCIYFSVQLRPAPDIERHLALLEKLEALCQR